jgi:hypothetical protein
MCNFLFDKKSIDLSLFQEEKDTRISEAWVLVVIGFSSLYLLPSENFLQDSEDRRQIFYKNLKRRRI